MDLLHDYWKSLTATGENVVACVVKIKDRLEEMSALAQETMRTAQQ